jgi:Kef-type K+ transport system membrane component KefB
VRGRPLSLAVRGWVASLILGLGIATLLHYLPIVHSPIMVALALSTTALGTLLPILRDAGEVDTGFGRLVLAAGAVGEFGPVVVMSVVLTGQFKSWIEVALMLVFVAIAFAAARTALAMRPPKILALLTRTMESSSQLPVRLSLLLLAVFVFLSDQFGFEAIPGAFAAGMVVGLASQGETGRAFRHKIEAVCFGFLVPFFFVYSGVTFDLATLLHSTQSLLLLPLFLVLLFVVRGTPVWFYRHDLAKAERLPFALYVATALPLVVAITQIGLRTKKMHPEIAVALVGAALVSVLLFPAIAGALRARDAARSAPSAAPTA